MNLYPSGVPLSEKRNDTWWVVIGIKEIKSQNMSWKHITVALINSSTEIETLPGSLRWVSGFLFWVWIKLGNKIGSLMKKIGVLLPTRSQFPRQTMTFVSKVYCENLSSIGHQEPCQESLCPPSLVVDVWRKGSWFVPESYNENIGCLV